MWLSERERERLYLSTEKDRDKQKKNMTETETEWTQITSYWSCCLLVVIKQHFGDSLWNRSSKLLFYTLENIPRLCDNHRLKKWNQHRLFVLQFFTPGFDAYKEHQYLKLSIPAQYMICLVAMNQDHNSVRADTSSTFPVPDLQLVPIPFFAQLQKSQWFSFSH